MTSHQTDIESEIRLFADDCVCCREIKDEEDTIKLQRDIDQLGSWARMDGCVRVLHPFNSISVISRRWKGEHERLCAMKRRLGLGRISPPVGFEPATLWSEVGSANRPAMRTLSWARKWGMRFQPVKCNMMQLTRKRNKKIHASYTLEGTYLENIFWKY